MSVRRVLGVCLGLCAAGCQIILGFEDHEPFPTGGAAEGGAGGGPSSGGAPPTGGFGGEGGSIEEVVLFDEPDELHTDLGAIEEMLMSEEGEIFYLAQDGGSFEIQKRSAGGDLTLLEADLAGASGLALAADYAITTTTGTEGFCHVLGVDREGVVEPLDIVSIPCTDGQKRIGAVGADGAHVMFAAFGYAGSQKSLVLRAEVTDVAVAGTTIGFGINKQASAPSALIDGASYHWLDSARKTLATSNGDEVTTGSAPGSGVTVVTGSLTGAREIVLRSGLYFVTTDTAVFRVSSGGDILKLADATNPTGLSVGADFVAWAEPTRVRAVRISDLALTTVATAGDGPTSTASDSTGVYFGTAGGRMVKVPPLAR